MNQSVGGGVRQQKVGGLAALYLAAALVAAMPYFLIFVKYPSITDPAEKVALLLGNQGSLMIMNLISYVFFGVAVALLALALYARLKDGAATLVQSATAVGLIWAVVLVASGMILNTGMETVVALHATSPAQAVTLWQAIEPVANGLESAGGEFLGGLWVLLLSLAALRTAGLPKGLSWFGVALGAAGILSLVPVLRELIYAFGLLKIVWLVWLGIVMLRSTVRVADPAMEQVAQPGTASGSPVTA